MLHTRNTAISDICSLTAGLSFRKKPEHHPDGNVCVVQPKNISSDGILNTENLCRISHTPKRPLQKGDVLLINRGRFTASVFDDSPGVPCVATSAFMILTPKDPRQVLPDYLALYLNSMEGQAHFKRITDASTVPFLSRANLESVQIPIPPLERQQELAQLGQMKQRYAALTTRKTELINNLINCELTTAN